MDRKKLTENYEQIKRTIRESCAKSGRNPDDVKLVAVTKYVTLETTKAVLDLGIEHIGESRVQEALPKWEALENRGTWHFIGHLQRNKVKDVIGRFTYIHSLDRHSLAKEIEKRASRNGLNVNCFVQVNVAGEESKFGLPVKDVIDFTREVIEQYPHIRVVGLMTMAPFVDDAEEVRPVFRELRQLRDKLHQLEHPQLQQLELSMGMSNDYHVAVEEGATVVRIGSSLVGREL